MKSCKILLERQHGGLENARVVLFSYLEERTLVNKIKSMILLFVYIFLFFFLISINDFIIKSIGQNMCRDFYNIYK